jgi:hypothetical protein
MCAVLVAVVCLWPNCAQVQNMLYKLLSCETKCMRNVHIEPCKQSYFPPHRSDKCSPSQLVAFLHQLLGH